MINEFIVPGDAGYDTRSFGKKNLTTYSRVSVRIPIKVSRLSGVVKNTGKMVAGAV